MMTTTPNAFSSVALGDGNNIEVEAYNDGVDKYVSLALGGFSICLDAAIIPDILTDLDAIAHGHAAASVRDTDGGSLAMIGDEDHIIHFVWSGPGMGVAFEVPLDCVGSLKNAIANEQTLLNKAG